MRWFNVYVNADGVMTYIGPVPGDSLGEVLRRMHFMFYDCDRIEAEPFEA